MTSAEELETRGYYLALKQLVEEMYEQNGKTKVSIVAHSYGGPISLYFLTRGIVTQEWKDTYIENYIPLAASWSGSNSALTTWINGLLEPGILGISQNLTSVVRSLQSTYFLLPHPLIWNDTILIITPTRKYTANDYQALFEDGGYPQGYSQYINLGDSYSKWPAPNVPTHCFYGTGLPTPFRFIYDEGFPDRQAVDTESGDGDGTVNLESSMICRRWSNSNGGYLFSGRAFKGVDHDGMIANEIVLNAIASIVRAPTDLLRGKRLH